MHVCVYECVYLCEHERVHIVHVLHNLCSHSAVEIKKVQIQAAIYATLPVTLANTINETTPYRFSGIVHKIWSALLI